jgi:hypothetical protein
MGGKNFTAVFTVDQTPEEVFPAINNISGWWSGEIDGDTNKPGGVFTYRREGVPRSKQKITESIPGKRIVWHVMDALLNFYKGQDRVEGNGHYFRYFQEGQQDGGPLHSRGPDSRIRVFR